MVKIASAAMNGTRNTEENLKIYQGFIDEAAAQRVDLLVLPELSLQGFPASMLACDPGEFYAMTRVAERVPEGPSTQYLIGQAKKHHMYLVWGMYETIAAARCGSTSLIDNLLRDRVPDAYYKGN